MKLLPLALAACLSLAGCAHTSITQASHAARAFAQAGPAIDQFLETEMATRHIPGLALAVVVDGRTVYAKGYGVAALESGARVSPQTPFLIASITKMFTATATMMLVEDGKVRLDAPIGDYLQDIPAPWRPLTVRQLLTHTSGLDSHTSHDTPPCSAAMAESERTRQDVIAEIACLPLKFEPGTNSAYSDTGYFLLGMLIERASGLTYEGYLRREIFTPLGMRATHLLAPIGARDDRATGYAWIDGRYERGPDLSPIVEGPSGGLVSTVNDLARFDGALARATLLPAPVLQTMWRPVEVGTARYGMGFGLRPIDGARQLGHTGGGPAAATSFARFPDDGFTIIILTNARQRPGTIQELVAGVARAVRAPDSSASRSAVAPR